MFKKSVFVAVMACVLSAGTFALDANFDKGDLAANVGLSFGWGIGVGGGAEYGIMRFDIAKQIPITIGAAARGYFSTAWGYSFLDLGVMATGHVSFKGLDLPSDMKKWTDRLDYYLGLGLGVSILGTDYWTGRSPINFASMTGVNYYLNKNLAINLESGYMGYWGYGLIGVTFKL